jgi:hypothetical protein
MSALLQHGAAGRALDPTAAVIAQSDYWRRGADQKEWSHFCVLARDVTLLVNLSLPVARAVLLARTDELGWRGSVETVDPGALDLTGGAIDARFGRTSLAFRSGAYELEAATSDGSVASRLRLAPCTRPALTSSIPLARAATMKWFVVPRLEATGTIVVRGRRFALERAPAYHDHDWGPFAWGGDFSWEWAVVLPEGSAAPWSFVFQRISDRARHRSLSQGLLAFRAGSPVKTLHGRDVSVRSEGLLRQRRPLRVPRVMSLVAPAGASDAPRRIEVRAGNGADVVELALELHDLAQIAIPNDGERPGVTLVCEAHARARVAGRLRGERIDCDAAALVELNRAPA